MATVRKRTWKTGGDVKTAWVADYFDQDGKRHIRTFKAQRAAKAWLAKTQHDVGEGIHTPDSTSVTVVAAARLWFDRCTLLVERREMERSTWWQYKSHVDHIAKSSIGNVKLARLTMPAVTHFSSCCAAASAWRPRARCCRA